MKEKRIKQYEGTGITPQNMRQQRLRSSIPIAQRKK